MTAQQLKNSILQMAVQGKLVPQNPDDEPASVLLERIKAEKQELIRAGKIKKDKKNSDVIKIDDVPFEIPDSWEWVRISFISSIVTKGTTPRGGNVSYMDNGIGFLRAENIAGLDKLSKIKLNYIDSETHNNFLKRSILKENDILITIAGTLGRTAIVRKEDLPLNANQAVSIVRLIDFSIFNLLYLIFALNSPIIQKILTEQKKITAIPNLTLEIISNCLLPIPYHH
ncbi:MAG: restriction endonuclease subunit S [Alistipes senegalensis]|nr:restriction endonuclease subunit S [Alistipes senegalensis]